MFRPVYEAVLERTRVRSGMRYLDVGCGAGMAAEIAAARGAQVSGIDAAEALLDIARRRTPGGDFRRGDMEELPFDDHCFDVVTGFNSLQYAGNPAVALREARRVTRPDGTVVVMTWGDPEGMEAASAGGGPASAVAATAAGGARTFRPFRRGGVAQVRRRGRAPPLEVFDIDCPFVYPDEATAMRGLNSAGVAVRAMETSGEQAVTRAHAEMIAPFRLPDGSYRIEATFRRLLARP